MEYFIVYNNVNRQILNNQYIGICDGNRLYWNIIWLLSNHPYRFIQTQGTTPLPSGTH